MGHVRKPQFLRLAVSVRARAVKEMRRDGSTNGWGRSEGGRFLKRLARNVREGALAVLFANR